MRILREIFLWPRSTAQRTQDTTASGTCTNPTKCPKSEEDTPYPGANPYQPEHSSTLEIIRLVE
ncbi:hypothetical protein BDW71DRAFT_179733 [Aspergillus fruticulosus]